jgi:hypothetical protein
MNTTRQADEAKRKELAAGTPDLLERATLRGKA